MKNRHDDTPVINDYTYYIFEEIEKRGLQFAIPERWKPVYRAFLRERKQRSKITAALGGVVDEFRRNQNRSESSHYSHDFGNRGTTTEEEDPQAD